MRKNYLFAILLSLVCFYATSCTNEAATESSNAQEQNYGKLLTSNEKFTCYELPATKGNLSKELIKVKELPTINIYFGENTDANSNEYAYKSEFYDADHFLFVMYTNIEETESGYIVKYNQPGISEDEYFLTRSMTKSMGEDTMDCISDLYTNRGWLSVVYTIESAFIPETVVVVAAVCAIHNA